MAAVPSTDQGSQRREKKNDLNMGGLRRLNGRMLRELRHLPARRVGPGRARAERVSEPAHRRRWLLPTLRMSGAAQDCGATRRRSKDIHEQGQDPPPEA